MERPRTARLAPTVRRSTPSKVLWLRVPFAEAIAPSRTHQKDFVIPYVKDLRSVVDLDTIPAAGLKLGVDPLGGAALPYWEPIKFALTTRISEL
jgi:phosphoglucomutase